MKFVITVLCSVLFLGWYTHSVSACDFMETAECIKKYVECHNASMCHKDTDYCQQDDQCLQATHSCWSTIGVMKYCSNKYNCTSPFMYKSVVMEHCKPHHHHHTSAGAPTLTSVTVVAGCILTYFVMKKNE